MSLRVRIAGVAAGIAVLIGVTAGITYAATAASVPSNDYAIACSSNAHTLRLVDAKGACPEGYFHINLASAPTALTVNASGSTARAKQVSIANFTFVAECNQDATNAELATLGVQSTTGFDVQGTDFFTGDKLAHFLTPGGSLALGPGQISFASTNSSSLSLYESGGVTGNALIIQSGHTIAVTFALFAYTGSCSVQAQLTPSD